MSERAWGTVREEYSASGDAWYAAWDLAFHCLPLALVGSEFAKEQLILMLREWYMHPNGQLPAYEWAFGDVNPPVHAWAAWRVYKIEKKRRGVRPVHASATQFQHDPHWRDVILFYEYFHGDTGSGVGASHQTGWTGLVAKLIQQSGE